MMTGTVGRLNTQLTELRDTLSYALIPRYGNAIRTLSSPGNGVLQTTNSAQTIYGNYH
jgi:hypothetical protein